MINICVDFISQATICRTNSIESKIREATKEVLKETMMMLLQCSCVRSTVREGVCRNCLRREVCNRLINLDYDCAICKSKWRSSSSIPSGKTNAHKFKFNYCLG